VDQQQRLLLAFALSILVWVGYQELVLKRYEQPIPPPEEIASPGEAPPEERSTSNTTLPPSPGAVPPSATPAKTVHGLAAPAAGATVIVDTDLSRITITSKGGRLLAVELKEYRETVERESPPLNLVRTGEVLPVTLRLTDGQSDAAVDYLADVASVQVHGSERRDVVLRGTLADGRAIEKRFTFQGDSYQFEVAARLSGSSSLGLVLPALPPLDPAGVGAETAVALQGTKYTYAAVSKLTAAAPLERPQSTWSGFATHYFLMAAVPLVAPSDAWFGIVDELPIARQTAAVGDSQAFAVYAGPKAESSLEHAGHDLIRALDFGYFWFAAIPLLHALRLLHRLIGNYGVSIILLTTGVKILTIPLTQATFRNMREMRKLQPQMTKLRERYKDDPAALQKEMMELYRRHRVNPFSGCVPMLLQLPIFVGLYNTLSSAIELRHAPFALWVRDLSAPDRLMMAGTGVPVLTLLMGATMLLQQWITPAQGDPTQQRAMMLMPLMFTFMFINLPSGLVLYWLVNNVLTITQQYWMLRTSK
jgi:YidC/Oxa1 family membrane protein insertase